MKVQYEYAGITLRFDLFPAGKDEVQEERLPLLVWLESEDSGNEKQIFDHVKKICEEKKVHFLYLNYNNCYSFGDRTSVKLYRNICFRYALNGRWMSVEPILPVSDWGPMEPGR